MAENIQTSRPADDGWTTVIRPRSGWFDINLKELWQYRDLTLMFVKRNFTVLYKQTILGPAWILLNPLITTLIFNVVFGNMAGMPTDGVPSFLFYMAGNTVWTFFANCVNNTANTFVTNSQVFARYIFPADHAGEPGADELNQLSDPGCDVPVLLGLFLCHRLRCAFHFVDAGTAAGHPAGHAAGFGRRHHRFVFDHQIPGPGHCRGIRRTANRYTYSSPVVYPLSMLDESPRLKVLVQLNPITAPIEVFRAATLGTGSVSAGAILYSVILTLAALVLGVVLFSRIEKTFMDTV